MLKNSLVQALFSEDTLTNNGAITHSTSQNFVLDLFFLAGACRDESEDKIKGLIAKAFAQDHLLTLKCIFWAGDIRGGAGERRFLKIALEWLSNNHPSVFTEIMHLVPHYNRWDSLFHIDNENILYFMEGVLKSDRSERNLLLKWLPREGKLTYKAFYKKLLAWLKMSRKDYRKMLSSGTKTVETKMCSQNWDKIAYNTVPSVAMNKYNRAFKKRDTKRFTQYIADAKAGKEKIHAGVILPHDIIRKGLECYSMSYRVTGYSEAELVQWANLPNYMVGNTKKMLPICDVSGSMASPNGVPISIALALSIYISERNEGDFKDIFITFSGEPQMQMLKGSLQDKVSQLTQTVGFNTDLQKTFDMLLDKCIQHEIPREEMPDSLLIISDMEFDSSHIKKTNLEIIKQKYLDAGYEIPNIVFWNVNGRVNNLPAQANEHGVALISGASPQIIKSVLAGNISPEIVMMNTLNSERYDLIKLG